MKKIFVVLYQLFNLLVLLTGSYFAAYSLQFHWLALALLAAAPLLQWMIAYDKSRSNTSKLRLPLVTLLMMLATAGLLLAVPTPGLALWLGFACIGGFVLNTYWADMK